MNQHNVSFQTETRLIILCMHMENVVAKQEAEHFNMDNWYGDKEEHVCGTVACAFGHAALIPRFQQQGLLPQHPCGSRVPTLYQRSTDPDAPNNQYQVFDGFKAAALFFDISNDVADQLFGSSNTFYATPLTWAKRTRHWLATGEFRPYSTFQF